MKRGLKESVHAVLDTRIRVTTYAPMKRGLKAPNPTSILVIASCYNLCPDEKGTESNPIRIYPKRHAKVTTYAPMKRGLKENIRVRNNEPTTVTTYAPMKRGLKV